MIERPSCDPHTIGADVLETIMGASFMAVVRLEGGAGVACRVAGECWLCVRQWLSRFSWDHPVWDVPDVVPTKIAELISIIQCQSALLHHRVDNEVVASDELPGVTGGILHKVGEIFQ